MSKPTGYVLSETAEIAVIATVESDNAKTGNMVQVWILNREIAPNVAIKTGEDSKICFDCPHRGDGTGKERTCYVQMRAPNSVWRAYQRGSYPYLPPAGYRAAFAGRRIRFGAYGEPVLIPLGVMAEIARVADGWTGYTHQWRKAEYAGYRAFLMASCDSAMDRAQANARGWRTFRVRSESEPMMLGEIACPASEEAGKRTQCVKCGLCNGARDRDARKDIAIIVHGSGSKNFAKPALIQVTLPIAA